MAGNTEPATEHTHLLPHNSLLGSVAVQHGLDAESTISSHLSKDELALGSTAVGERLAYNDYTTIDWLHDLVRSHLPKGSPFRLAIDNLYQVKDSFRARSIHSRKGLRYSLLSAWDSSQGWVAAALIGTFTACVAFVVDISVATVSDWKMGYCTSNVFASRENCCTDRSPLVILGEPGENCSAWHQWTSGFWREFGIYLGLALLYGIISGGVTMTTKKALPAAAPGKGDKYQPDGRAKAKQNGHAQDEPSGNADAEAPTGKSLYMAAGSGIPEIKTILSGFVIPHFLDFKILVVKAIGSMFAVSTGMCLGKEGPFVHISACVSYLVAMRFPKYTHNSRKMREILSAGVASGLSVAFGAPIGGVLFAYEEISTYFPRKVLWRAFICSLFAAMTLRALNPTGTGKLVLFETDYATSYSASHYLIFVVLGIAGGLFGGIFCKANFLWSRTFRKYSAIKNHPVFEVFLVALATALIQYPNPLTREPGDVIIKNLLVDCEGGIEGSWVCDHENSKEKSKYIGWLVYGTLAKLLLTIITFGIKVPSGIIIPALDGGAFFGRLVGQLVPSISPGIFAMVGAGAFLAGVSRMTISLAVIMFELTGELEFIVPNMIGIMVAKWIADALEREGVYDLAQTVLGHPFLDADHAMQLVRSESHLVGELIPPEQTMKEITVDVPPINRVHRRVLEEKLSQLKRRGLMDAGLVLVQNGMLQGYLAEGELEFGLTELGKAHHEAALVRLLGHAEHVDEFDMTSFVDRTPLTICAKAPMEYAVEMFGKLGLRQLCVVEDGSGKLVGVIIKKRLVVWLESLKE
jgi:chloride channel 3/4/5